MKRYTIIKESFLLVSGRRDYSDVTLIGSQGDLKHRIKIWCLCKLPWNRVMEEAQSQGGKNE